MDILLYAILIFLGILELFIWVDVISSWLTIMGLNLRIKFIQDVLNPIYTLIKKYIPTTIGMLELTPIILLLAIYFLKGLIFQINPSLLDFYK